MKKYIQFIRTSILFMAVLFMLSIPVKAGNTVTLDQSYLNKEKCWTVAGRYVTSQYSRPRIAVEIYAHAIADNLSYRTLQSKLGSSTLLAKFATEVRKHAHVVNIGDDSSSRVSLYYKIWNVIPSSVNNTYVLRSRLNKYYSINAKNNRSNNGTILQLNWRSFSYLNSGQRFQLFYNGDGSYTLLKENTFQAIDVCGGVRGSGVYTQLWQYNGTNAQRWFFRQASGGYYMIQNAMGYYLDAQNASAKNGTRIWVYSKNNTNAQMWGLYYR